MPILGQVDIPSSITSIESSAFNDCSLLTTVTLNEGLTTLGTSAFADTAITSITIPSTLDFIGNQAFAGCFNLQSVIIKNGSNAKSIGWRSFYDCDKLQSVTLPNTLNSIDSGAFYYCTNLKNVLFLGNAPLSFGSGVFDDTDPGFHIEYRPGTTGFTNPWQGYPTRVASRSGDFNGDFNPDLFLQSNSTLALSVQRMYGS